MPEQRINDEQMTRLLDRDTAFPGDITLPDVALDLRDARRERDEARGERDYWEKEYGAILRAGTLEENRSLATRTDLLAQVERLRGAVTPEAALWVLEEAGVGIDTLEAVRNQLPGAGGDEAALATWTGETG